jgi:c-di-GMP-binding flagellar brake protein YcgR
MKDIEKLFVERRDWPRLALDALVEEALIRFPEGSTFQEPAIEIVNFSEAGAGILLPLPAERGTRITLEIAGKDIRRFDVQAEIRWVGKKPVSTGQYAAGLKFMNLDENRRVELRKFIQILRLHSKGGV